MKLIILFIALCPIAAFSQTKSYGTLRPLFVSYSNEDASYGGVFSTGVRGKDASIGIGVGGIKFPHVSTVYVPVFGEFSFFVDRIKDAGPFFNFQAGYGFFSDGNVSGGLFVHPNAGFLIDCGSGVRLLITGGYISSDFKVKALYPYDNSTSYSSHGFTLSIGVML